MSASRKAYPITTGVLDYFPDALLAVAEVSRIGNDQHNAGEPLHWSRGKSNDHADALARHLIDRGGLDDDGVRHSAKVAWRALALLQTEIERDRAARDASMTSAIAGTSAWLRQHATAFELADADGCAEYGNPITPGCAPWRLP